MGRDDWKYDEEMWEGGEDEKMDSPPDKQCRQCLHWVPRDASYCPWCGKVFPDRDPPK